MNILIIDDSPNIRKALKKTLQSFIPEIKVYLESEDIKDAITKIEINKPDLIILDLMLKSGTGLDLLKDIHLKNIRPLIILYSNFLAKEYKATARKFGVEEFFDKSDDIAKLVEIIKKYV